MFTAVHKLRTAIQALDRLDPVLPLSPGRAERHGLEYYRHGRSRCMQLWTQKPAKCWVKRLPARPVKSLLDSSKTMEAVNSGADFLTRHAAQKCPQGTARGIFQQFTPFFGISYLGSR
jgi:hypothetical protein